MKLSREEIILTLWFLFTVVMMNVGACHLGPGPITPVDPDPEQREFDCRSACARLRELHCPAAEDTVGGATCEQVCINVQESGFIAWDLECRSVAVSCDMVERCEH
jgi:hypothetical protein